MIAGLGICKPTPGIGNNFWIGLSSGLLFMCFHLSSQNIMRGSLAYSSSLTCQKHSVLSPTSLASCLSYKLLLKYEFHLEVESVVCPWHIPRENDDFSSELWMWPTQEKAMFHHSDWMVSKNQTEDPGVTTFMILWNKVPEELLANWKGHHSHQWVASFSLVPIGLCWCPK